MSALDDLKMPGAQLISKERNRQLKVEGWSADHDDDHSDGELVDAAVCYARCEDDEKPTPREWPWDSCWWKPKGRIRNLVRAGALIAAEIDRLQRLDEEDK